MHFNNRATVVVSFTGPTTNSNRSIQPYILRFVDLGLDCDDDEEMKKRKEPVDFLYSCVSGFDLVTGMK